MREIYSCSCLTVLLCPAWLLLNKISIPFFRALYKVSVPLSQVRAVWIATCETRHRNKTGGRTGREGEIRPCVTRPPSPSRCRCSGTRAELARERHLPACRPLLAMPAPLHTCRHFRLPRRPKKLQTTSNAPMSPSLTFQGFPMQKERRRSLASHLLKKYDCELWNSQ